MSHFGVPRLRLTKNIQTQTPIYEHEDNQNILSKKVADLEEKLRILEYRFRQEQFICFTFETKNDAKVDSVVAFKITNRTIKHFIEGLVAYVKIGTVVWVIKDKSEPAPEADSIVRKHRYIIELREQCHISLIKTIVNIFKTSHNFKYLKHVYDFEYTNKLPEGSQESVKWINNHWIF